MKPGSYLSLKSQTKKKKKEKKKVDLCGVMRTAVLYKLRPDSNIILFSIIPILI